MTKGSNRLHQSRNRGNGGSHPWRGAVMTSHLRGSGGALPLQLFKVVEFNVEQLSLPAIHKLGKFMHK